jgi:transposase InsO family protein
MQEEKKKQIATFRFKVIADLVGDVCLEKGQMEKLIQEKAKRRWEIPYSKNSLISPSTIRRWINAYNAQNGDIKALFPKDRVDKGLSRAIDEETGSSLLHLKEEFPNLGVPELLFEMQQRNLIHSVNDLKRTTVYRFFHQNGGLRKTPAKIDHRRFEAEFPNDLWQSDVMHGPKVKVDGKTQKSYLIAFIDDHSRLVPHAAFYENERVATFIRALSQALIFRGLPRKLYCDNGSAFRSKQLEFAMASLQVSLIHARPYSPQGKGKIERFFKTVRSGFLARELPDNLEELNRKFKDWLDNRYHQSIHSSTGEMPLVRFTKNIELIREAPEDLCDNFRTVDLRTVTKDRIVHLNGSLYEAPIDLIGERVEVVHFPGNPESIEIRFKGESYGYLETLDLGVNSKVRRDKTGEELFLEEDEGMGPPDLSSGQLFSEPEDDDPEIDDILF